MLAIRKQSPWPSISHTRFQSCFLPLHRNSNKKQEIEGSSNSSFLLVLSLLSIATITNVRRWRIGQFSWNPSFLSLNFEWKFNQFWLSKFWMDIRSIPYQPKFSSMVLDGDSINFCRFWSINLGLVIGVNKSFFWVCYVVESFMGLFCSRVNFGCVLGCLGFFNSKIVVKARSTQKLVYYTYVSPCK